MGLFPQENFVIGKYLFITFKIVKENEKELMAIYYDYVRKRNFVHALI